MMQQQQQPHPVGVPFGQPQPPDYSSQNPEPTVDQTAAPDVSQTNIYHNVQTATTNPFGQQVRQQQPQNVEQNVHRDIVEVEEEPAPDPYVKQHQPIPQPQPNNVNPLTQIDPNQRINKYNQNKQVVQIDEDDRKEEEHEVVNPETTRSQTTNSSAYTGDIVEHEELFGDTDVMEQPEQKIAMPMPIINQNQNISKPKIINRSEQLNHQKTDNQPNQSKNNNENKSLTSVKKKKKEPDDEPIMKGPQHPIKSNILNKYISNIMNIHVT
eukprot:UN30648